MENDRKNTEQIIELLKQAIADPSTPEDKRAEYREELGDIVHS